MAERRTQRKLAAILAADVVGYSRLVGADEEGTLARFKALRAELVDPKINEYGGRIVKLMGDGMLVEFASVVDAVRAATEAQQALAERNRGIDEAKRIALRFGINVGDVVIDGDDIHGDGVNVAARLQEIAEPGGVAISADVQRQLRGRLDTQFQDFGEQALKNIAEPVQVWRWAPRSSADAPAEAEEREGAPPVPADRPSIVVLPFDNMSGDPEQEFFVDGITEDIITTLSKVPELLVIARNSAFVYKGQSIDVKKVGHELGVRYVLEGSARKSGNRTRITAQLIDAQTGIHLWADRYDGSLDDVFALQDEITQEIVGALEVKLSAGEQARVWRRRAGDPRVYDHFLRGRALYFRQTRHANAQARQEFEAALKFSPDFSGAVVFLGYTYADDMRWGWSEAADESLQTAWQLARRCLEIDQASPEGNALLAYVSLLRREHEEAIAHAQQAIALGPSSADSHHVAAIVFNYSGLPEEGASVAKQAIRLSPIAPSNYLTEIGHSLCLLGRYEEAIPLLSKALAEMPFWSTARALLVVALSRGGKGEEARAEAQRMLRKMPRFSLGSWAKCHPYRHPADLERYIGALREAGLPD